VTFASSISIGGRVLRLPATIGNDSTAIGWASSQLANIRVPVTSWVMLAADYTLTSTVASQKAFDTTANGTLTVGTGVYEFDAFLYLTNMSSAASNNLTFDVVGAGTATTDRWGHHSTGLDNNSPLATLARSGSASVASATQTNIVNGATGTGMVSITQGMFRVSTAGTIIPSVALGTAAAAVMKAGSWFRVRRVGEASETYAGAWT
jgi:hypothetical protein